MEKHKFLKYAKVFVLILFLISAYQLYQYETGVKGYYESNPEHLQSDKEKIISYLSEDMCASIDTIAENINKTYDQARYVLTKLSENRTVLKYPGKGICLSFPARVRLELQQNR